MSKNPQDIPLLYHAWLISDLEDRNYIYENVLQITQT